jgi:hypothetical protein
MTREELDKMWQKAMHESIAAGEKYARYHFAALVAEHEREACLQIADQCADADMHASMVANAIRARSEV